MKRLQFYPLFVGLLCLLAGACQSTPKSERLPDLAHSRLGVLLGSSQEKYAAEAFPESELLRIDMASDLLLALKSGSCDAILLSSFETAAILKDHPELEVVEGAGNTDHLGIGFRPEDKELCDRFNEFLAGLKADGIFDDIYRRWMTDAPGQSDLPQIELPATEKPLRVGTTCMSLPFSFTKENRPVGFDIELTTRFAAYLGRPVKFVTMNFGSLIPALSTGNIDVIANNIMMTEERAKAVRFSDPYMEVPTVALVLRKGHQPKALPQSLDELEGKSVGCLMGSIHEQFLSQQYPQIERLCMENASDLVQALLTRKCDGVIAVHALFQEAIKKHPQIVSSRDTVMVENIVAAFHPENLELRDQFNQFLHTIEADGTLQAMKQRYFAAEPDLQMPHIPLPTEGKPLRVGSMGGCVPWTFVLNGEYCGFEMELMRRFAAHLGRPMEVSDINFGALPAALISGKIDVMAAIVADTPERRKAMALSDCYHLLNTALYVLRESSENQPPFSFGQWWNELKQSFHNNLIAENRYQLIVDGLKITLFITLCAALLGTLLGGLVCFLRMHRNRLLSHIAMVYINFMRGMPVLVLLMLMFYVILAPLNTSGIAVAIITFGMNLGAYAGEIFRTAIEGIDRGQSEAGVALGFTRLQTFLYIILPQATRSAMPVYKGELISLLKTTSIVGYIAVVDLTKASDIIRARTFDAFFPLLFVAAIYFLAAWLLGKLLDLTIRSKR